MRNVIVGSGPAAAGAAIALVDSGQEEVLVLDLGTRLDPVYQAIVNRLAGQEKERWSADDVDAISRQSASRRGRLPQKTTFGSDYPFRNHGQLSHVEALGTANGSVVSAAYGGFSNVWGAQAMPFSRGTFRSWPFAWRDIEPSYKAVLKEVPLAAEEDDLSDLFPVLAAAAKLPQLGERSELVLGRYGAHRRAVRESGVTVGKARLAFNADECVKCGLCMSGCPYSLIYSAARTFDRLQASRAITYRSGVLAVEVGQDGSDPYVLVQTNGGGCEKITTDRLFLACGGLGTTQLVLGSLKGALTRVELQESQQFVLPFVSRTATRDPRLDDGFTLNQVNLVLDLNGDGVDLSQIHLYPYNPAFLAALPRPLQGGAMPKVTSGLLGRLTAGLGYLPSWASPKVSVDVKGLRAGELPEVALSSGAAPPLSGTYYRSVMKQLLRVAPRLDLWPVLPAGYRAGGAKSYHFGGSFPHSERFGRPRWMTDRLGRLSGWSNIHLIDGSVFPNVPATTFTLTVMANAHRIATEASIVRST